MRYVLIIPDGAADRPNKDLGGKTPLEVAHIPNMDKLAKEGILGRSSTVPEGMAPGSDVANLSILGYDPKVYYTGRAPLEAANRNITLADDQAVFRANTVTIKDGIMVDFAGAHPTNDEAYPLIDFIQANHNIEGVKLHHGVSYRHLCVIDNMAKKIPNTTPPHDITDEEVTTHLPSSEILCKVMNRSQELLKDYELNIKRAAAGKNPVSQLWLWGGGTMPKLPTYKERFGLTGAMISAVDLLQGIAKLGGLEVIEVEGATGFYDTNFKGKGEAALKALETLDFVAVHVEAPDEAGHNGEPAEKVRALENIDKYIVGPIIEEAERCGDIRILCMPDHPTPLEIKTHSSDPVLYAMWGADLIADESTIFTEESASTKEIIKGSDLIGILFNK